MSKLLTIKEAADSLGVSPQTLRRWERSGKGPKSQRTSGGQRRYHSSQLFPLKQYEKAENLPTLAYARVSSHDQKEDLRRQENMLEMFCSSHGWTYELLSDLGSGMNYQKRGLKNCFKEFSMEASHDSSSRIKIDFFDLVRNLFLQYAKKRESKSSLSTKGRKPHLKKI